MEFLKKLFGGSKTPKDETAEAVFIYSQCEKCQEKFRNRIDKQYDLQMNYADEGPAYRSHKELIGSKCRNKILVDLEFDQSKRLIAKSIQNGEFITREEFEAEMTGEQ
jgi:uncharacterized protein YktA (UPF0223 family)